MINVFDSTKKKKEFFNLFIFILVPLIRKNKNHVQEDENKIKTFERQKQCITKVADINELRKHLTAVRTHIDEIKQHQQVPVKSIPAHERFAHLLDEKPSVNESLSTTPIKKIASPADLRRSVQATENERVKKIRFYLKKNFFFKKFS